MNYHLVTLGCQMNKSDSERIATVIEQMGYTQVDCEDDADLIGIVACSVRQKAIDKVYSKISNWNKWKKKKNLVTFVTGCVLPADRDKFLRLFDLIFQISELNELPEMLRQYGVTTPFSLAREETDESFQEEKSLTVKGQKVELHTLSFDHHKSISGEPVLMKKPETRISGFWDIEPHYQSTYEAYIPIQNGCDKFCTFCAVPYTRGREISRPSNEIIQELKTLVNRGFKSITLLGQNVNSYGKDKKGDEVTFAELLRKIGEFGNESGKDFWLYFTSPHPSDMTDDVLEVVSQYDCLAKQIHLPMQSGDNEVLKKMNRSHTMDDYHRIIAAFRKYLPDATLFTDIIVGFTNETEEQFLNTKAAMEEIKFNMAYIARYSPRPGAAASRWEDDISHEVKKDRLHRLSNLLQEHSLEHNKAMVGKTYKVLVTRTDRKSGQIAGLTEGKIIVRILSKETALIGSFVDVKITSAADFATEGELINADQLS